MTVIRSTIFALALVLLTPPYALLALLCAPLPRHTRYAIISGWSRAVVLLARAICGIRWKIEGREHLPPGPAVILSKHQSAWETLAFQIIFPHQSLVLKRELLRIPFFGWGLALMSPIPIDRSRGPAALRAIVRRGARRLGQAFWIVVFPEGTRVQPGERRPYQIGGAWLAVHCGVPIVPVALDAGRCWPKNAFLKRPGTITVRIGPAVATASRRPAEVLREVEEWIEGEQRALLAGPASATTSPADAARTIDR